MISLLLVSFFGSSDADVFAPVGATSRTSELQLPIQERSIGLLHVFEYVSFLSLKFVISCVEICNKRHMQNDKWVTTSIANIEVRCFPIQGLPESGLLKSQPIHGQSPDVTRRQEHEPSSVSQRQPTVNAEQKFAELGVSFSHPTGRVHPHGLKTQSAAPPAQLVHERHKKTTGIRRHP